MILSYILNICIWINFLSVSITLSLSLFMVLCFCAVNQHHQHRLWSVPFNSNPSWFGLVCLMPFSEAAAIVFKKKIVHYVYKIYQTDPNLLDISFTHILLDVSSFMGMLYSTTLLIEFTWNLLNTWWNVPLHLHCLKNAIYLIGGWTKPLLKFTLIVYVELTLIEYRWIKLCMQFIVNFALSFKVTTIMGFFFFLLWSVLSEFDEYLVAN